MNPIAPALSIENHPGSLSAESAAKVNETIHDKKLHEFCCLLKHHTPDGFLSLFKENRTWQIQLKRFFSGNSVNEVRWCDGLATWLLSNRETEAFIACLKMVGTEEIKIDSKSRAETLLEAVRSQTPISGLELVVELDDAAQPGTEVVELLAGALRINNGLDTLKVRLGRNYVQGLAPLTEALRLVKDLKLEVHGFILSSETIMLFADLFSRNKEIEWFELHHAFFLGSGPMPECTAAMDIFLETLKAQGRLRHLHLDGVPQTGQAALGDFIAESQVLTELDVSLHGDACTEPLVDAFSKNTTIECLRLNVTSIEDGMLPIINRITDNQCSLEHFSLETRCGREDDLDVRCISTMLASNCTLSSFTWKFKSPQIFDLVMLGESLAKNTRLERIYLNRNQVKDVSQKFLVESRTAGQLPEFGKLLSKNRSLANFKFYPGNGAFGTTGVSHPLIDMVLNRNFSYQNYACSEGFIKGAACGFFEASSLPGELGYMLAPALLKQKPRLEASALAFVNKATYRWALHERRKEGVNMIDNVLAAAERNGKNVAGKMEDLLHHIAVVGQDYSVDQLREIAGIPHFAYALVQINRPEEVAYLVSCFSEVVGRERMRTLIAAANKHKKLAAKPSS